MAYTFVTLFILTCATSQRVLEGQSLIQRSVNPHYASYSGLTQGGFLRKYEGTKAHACAALENRGTHFTVDVSVGTPMQGTEEQTFSVVADTGSNALIVPSCLCDSCKTSFSKDDKCFTGTNRSSTFSVVEGEDGPYMMMITFGSGPVEGVVGKDMAKIGNLSVNMTSGLLLMTGQKLQMEGSFEGILGLGLPGAAKEGQKQEEMYAKELESGKGVASPATSATSQADAAEIIKQIFGGGSAGVDGMDIEDVIGAIGSDAGGDGGADASGDIVMSSTLEVAQGHGARFPIPAADIPDASADKNKKSASLAKKPAEPNGFLEEAGIHHFSMCFNENTPGVLRLGSEGHSTKLGSMGKLHWGLDMRGVSVGSGSYKTASLAVCDPKNMTKDQESACGMIPDSGTTLIMAPKDQLEPVFDSICEGWDRCKKNFTALLDAQSSAKAAAEKEYGVDPFGLESEFKKSTVLKLLLSDCDRWLNESKDGLNELPALNFHVAGVNDTETQTLSLSGWGYVIESMEDTGEIIYKDVPGLGKVPIGVNKTGIKQRVCMPAISAMEQDYVTQKNGPVWIVGTPLFYEFQVGYHMQTDPPSMSFTSTKETPCGSCGAEHVSLATVGSRGQAWRPRRIEGKPRLPKIDVTLPL